MFSKHFWNTETLYIGYVTFWIQFLISLSNNVESYKITPLLTSGSPIMMMGTTVVDSRSLKCVMMGTTVVHSLCLTCGNAFEIMLRKLTIQYLAKYFRQNRIQ